MRRPYTSFAIKIFLQPIPAEIKTPPNADSLSHWEDILWSIRGTTAYFDLFIGSRKRGGGVASVSADGEIIQKAIEKLEAKM